MVSRKESFICGNCNGVCASAETGYAVVGAKIVEALGFTAVVGDAAAEARSKNNECFVGVEGGVGSSVVSTTLLFMVVSIE